MRGVHKLAVAQIAVEFDALAFVGFGGAIALGRTVERAEQIALCVPLNVVADEEIGLAVAVVVEPGGAGAKGFVCDARGGGDIAELEVAFVVEEPVSVERLM